jgi:hypothetical protein
MYIRGPHIFTPLPWNNRTELIPILPILEVAILPLCDGAHDAGRTNIGRLRAKIICHGRRVVPRIKSDNSNLGQTCFQLASEMDRQRVDRGFRAVVSL